MLSCVIIYTFVDIHLQVSLHSKDLHSYIAIILLLIALAILALVVL